MLPQLPERLPLFFPTIVLERLDGVAGMRRGSALVDGHRWRVLGIGVVMSLLVYILVSIPVGVVTVILGAIIAVNELSTGVRAMVEIVNAFMSAVGQSLFGALAWIASTIVYYELRVRKEAFDLEQLAERGDVTQLPPPYPAPDAAPGLAPDRE